MLNTLVPIQLPLLKVLSVPSSPPSLSLSLPPSLPLSLPSSPPSLPPSLPPFLNLSMSTQVTVSQMTRQNLSDIIIYIDKLIRAASSPFLHLSLFLLHRSPSPNGRHGPSPRAAHSSLLHQAAGHCPFPRPEVLHGRKNSNLLSERLHVSTACIL